MRTAAAIGRRSPQSSPSRQRRLSNDLRMDHGVFARRQNVVSFQQHLAILGAEPCPTGRAAIRSQNEISSASCSGPDGAGKRHANHPRYVDALWSDCWWPIHLPENPSSLQLAGDGNRLPNNRSPLNLFNWRHRRCNSRRSFSQGINESHTGVYACTGRRSVHCDGRDYIAFVTEHRHRDSN